MPGWLAGVLTYGAGVLSGVVVALVSAGFGVWFQERRDRRNQGMQLLARLHGLVARAQPGVLLFLAQRDQERAERAGREIWDKWRELDEPLRIFAFDAPEPVQRAAKDAATHVALSVEATRRAIEAADDPETRADLKTAAEKQYKIAQECLDDLDRAFAGRELSRVLHAEQRRTG
jgi:hypothetical protein